MISITTDSARTASSLDRITASSVDNAVKSGIDTLLGPVLGERINDDSTLKRNMAISQTVPPTMQTSHHPLLIPHRPPVSSQYNLARLEMIVEIETEAEAVNLREVIVGCLNHWPKI